MAAFKEKLSLLKREPSRVLGGLAALASGAALFGFLGADKEALIKGLAAALGTYFVAGEGTRSQVRPEAEVVPLMAATGLKVVQELDAVAAGAPGQVTEVATQKVADVVAELANKPTSLAHQVTARVKAKVLGAGA